MITICWAAKGGSGTTVVAATRALTTPHPTLLVDLAGDLPTTLGLTHPDGPGVSGHRKIVAGQRLEPLR